MILLLTIMVRIVLFVSMLSHFAKAWPYEKESNHKYNQTDGLNIWFKLPEEIQPSIVDRQTENGWHPYHCRDQTL